MAKKKQVFKALDIVVLTDDRVFQVVEPRSASGAMLIRWMDSDQETFMFDSEKIYVREVIPHSYFPHLVFLAARSIHQRLNNLSKV